MESVEHHSSYRSVLPTYRSALPTQYMIDAAIVSPIDVRWKSAVCCGLSSGLPVGCGVCAIEKCSAPCDFLCASWGLKSDEPGRLLFEHAAGKPLFASAPSGASAGSLVDPLAAPVRCYPRASGVVF